MRTPFTSSRIIRPLLLGTPIAVVLAFVIFASSSPFYFEVTIQSSLSSTAQVYYDIGFGIRDADSVRRPIRDGNAALRYRFPLPNGTYRGLRFDPSDLGGASITIRNALIVDRGGHVLRKFRPVQFRPAQQISRFDVQKDVLLVATASGGTDPILSIDVNDRFTLKESPINAVAHAARLFLVCLLTVTGVGLLASTVAIQLRPLVTGWSLAAANWTRRSPRKALLVIAVTSVVISCYPVVFFGKSFLSPNNHSGTFLLYGRMPTVPGYRDATTDDEKGSDLGAAIWYSWPVSIVESRALFRNFELPLWNRYNSTGLPLLGQGQSTFGDPLHLLVLLGGSSSGWWDLKYILAKLLFAICLGLCVLQATKHLPAALIISASVPFIGFFFWRYNHPAFFSFCYAPWILFCYFKLIDAPAGRRTVVWFTALILADWMVTTSGTVKEAYVLLLAMNSCGLLITLLYGPPNRAKVAKLIGVVFASFLFVLLATPVWLTFLDSLKVSRTAYDAAGAYQIQPSLFIGLFDDIFYRQFNANETNLDPSANFLILLAVLWFLVSSRKDGQIAFSRGLSIGCLVALAFVFGIVPSSWIVRLPFLSRIFHIDNTFSCVSIIFLFVLAGFGIKAFWSDCQAAEFKQVYFRAMSVFVCLLALYLGSTTAAQRSTRTLLQLGEQIPKSNFFWYYFLSLLLATAAMPWIGRMTLCATRIRSWQIFCLVLIFVLMHWRFGMHLTTPFDPYVMNPHQRVDLFARSSSALKLVKTRGKEPARSAGLDSNLFPGYGAGVGVEEIDGPDPLENRYYHNLMMTAGMKLFFGAWRYTISEQTLQTDLPLFNMLNVRYFLAPAGAKLKALPSLIDIASLDLEVFESKGVWPRAFFTDEFVSYRGEKQFVELLRTGDGAPFAAIPQEELDTHAKLRSLLTATPPAPGRRVIPAVDYALTNNLTSFKIRAPSRGVIVLTEPYEAGNFQLRINGKSAQYFRVNSAFKGVLLEKGGDYEVRFRYWPQNLIKSIWIAASGLILLVFWLFFTPKSAATSTLLERQSTDSRERRL